eukprot:scaffold18082_cov29-Attheya_sp.AAC.1
MEAPEQVSEPPDNYSMTPTTANTTDRQRYAGWVGVGFIDISLVEDPAIKRGGCGACGKGTNGGKRDDTVFWGGTKPVRGGMWRIRLAKEGGLNEED